MRPLILPSVSQPASPPLSFSFRSAGSFFRFLLRSASLFAEAGEQIKGCQRWELLLRTAGQMDG